MIYFSCIPEKNHAPILKIMRVPKRSVVFSKRNTKFRIAPKRPFETQNFEICTQTAICFSEQNREF